MLGDRLSPIGRRQPGGAGPARTANTMTSVNAVPSTWSAKQPGPLVLNRPNHALQSGDEGAACSSRPPSVVWTAETIVVPCCLSLTTRPATAVGSRLSAPNVICDLPSPPNWEARTTSGPEYLGSTMRMASWPPAYQLACPAR